MAARRLAGPAGPVRARRADRRVEGTATVIFPRFHQWDAVLPPGSRRPGRGAGPDVSGAALGRVGEVEHDRLAGAPAVVAARRDDEQGVRQGGGHHRPGGAGPAVAGHDLPVRARPRCRRDDRHRTPAQLADALAGEQARIIITTLQKFPFVLRHVDELPAASVSR